MCVAGQVNEIAPKAGTGVVLSPRKLFSVSITVLDRARAPVATGGGAGWLFSEGCASDCANVAVVNAPAKRQSSPMVSHACY